MARFGTHDGYHRELCPTPGPATAVSFPGGLGCHANATNDILTPPGVIHSCRVISFIIFVRGVLSIGERPKPRGSTGAYEALVRLRKSQCTYAEGSW